LVRFFCPPKEMNRKGFLIFWGMTELQKNSKRNAEMTLENLSSSAAEVSGDSTKRFIRTAQMRFRVENVRKATLSLEDIIRKNGGHVTYTHLCRA